MSKMKLWMRQALYAAVKEFAADPAPTAAAIARKHEVSPTTLRKYVRLYEDKGDKVLRWRLMVHIPQGEGQPDDLWDTKPEPDAAAKLICVLGHVYRFPHNVNLYDLLRQVYGKEADMGYMKEKADLIDRKGFTFWYCELDLDHQRKIAGIMLERYKDLEGMMRT